MNCIEHCQGGDTLAYSVKPDFCGTARRTLVVAGYGFVGFHDHPGDALGVMADQGCLSRLAPQCVREVIVHENLPDTLGQYGRVPGRKEQPGLSFLDQTWDTPSI